MEENKDERCENAREDSDSKFAYPPGEEPMYRDEHGNLLTPDEFRAHLGREETEEEREARFRLARETQRRLLGDEVADALEESAKSPESREDRSHRPRRVSER